MRKCCMSVMFVGVLSVAASPASATVDREEAEVAVVVQSQPDDSGIRDQAMMVLVGSALIGLAAAVRRVA